MKQLSDLPAYRTFSNKKDAFLEQLLLKARERQGDKLRRYMQLCRMELIARYPHSGEVLTAGNIAAVRGLSNAIDGHAINVAMDMAVIWKQFRKQVFQFSYAATSRAILNVGLPGAPKRLGQHVLHEETHADTALGNVRDRAYLGLARIASKFIDNVRMSLVMEEDISQATKRAMSAFPLPETVKKNNVLRRMQEARDPLYGDEEEKGLEGPEFIDQEEWDKILEEYKDKYVPEWRDPRKGELEWPVSIGTEDDYVVYAWQLENEMMEDFVAKVSAGEVEAANEQGITQFVWIAVLDKKTDECCVKRNGLTNTEIADKLEDEWAGDECQATVPPAHFNCRCRAVPATDELPDKPASNKEDFEDWLNS